MQLYVDTWVLSDMLNELRPNTKTFGLKGKSSINPNLLAEIKPAISGILYEPFYFAPSPSV